MDNINEIIINSSNDNLEGGDSTVQKSLENRKQFFSQGNTALKQEAIEQPAASSDTSYLLPVCTNNAKIIDAEYIVEESELSEEKSKELALTVANDNMFPTFPTDPKALVPYITVAKKAVEAETMLLKTLVMVPKKYNQVLATAQEHAGLLLKAELLLAEQLKGIKTCRGMRSDIINKKFKGKLEKEIKLKNKSKKDVIMNDYNPKEYKPVNADGSPSGARFKSSFSRLRWDKPCNTITTDNQSVGGMINLHPGRPLTDGTYSDSRPLSILELIRVTGLPDDFFIPTWASNADSFIREVIGECFAPLHVKALLSTLPVFANDNTASEETTVEAEEKTSEVKKKEIAE